MKTHGAAPRLTALEYARLPEDGCRHELQAGALISEPQPFPRHGRIQVQLAHALAEYVRPRRLGIVLTDVGFLLSTDPDTVRGPDVAFVRRTRYDERTEADAFFRGAPDLAVEIRSASNRPGEIHAKVADYLAAGSTLVWVIDPERRSADVYRTLLAPRRVAEEETLEGEDVLPGFTVPLASLLAL